MPKTVFPQSLTDTRAFGIAQAKIGRASCRERV